MYSLIITDKDVLNQYKSVHITTALSKGKYIVCGYSNYQNMVITNCYGNDTWVIPVLQDFEKAIFIVQLRKASPITEWTICRL